MKEAVSFPPSVRFIDFSISFSATHRLQHHRAQQEGQNTKLCNFAEYVSIMITLTLRFLVPSLLPFSVSPIPTNTHDAKIHNKDCDSQLVSD